MEFRRWNVDFRWLREFIYLHVLGRATRERHLIICKMNSRCLARRLKMRVCYAAEAVYRAAGGPRAPRPHTACAGALSLARFWCSNNIERAQQREFLLLLYIQHTRHKRGKIPPPLVENYTITRLCIYTYANLPQPRPHLQRTMSSLLTQFTISHSTLALHPQIRVS